MGLYEQLLKLLAKEESVKRNELLGKHTTLKIGGPADYLVTPASVSEIKNIMEVCRENEVPVFVMGRGSNILAGDGGYRGVVIKISGEFADFYIEEAGMSQDGDLNKDECADAGGGCMSVYAQAGISLSKIAAEAAKAGLTGFECESGIPGSLGGAVAMNAGAYGGEIKDFLDWVLLLTPELSVVRRSKEEMEMGYRSSYVLKHPGTIVLGAHFTLPKGNREEIYSKMEEFNRKRREKQPLELPSAGSTFKRPEGYFAGKLIEDSGLKGYRIGDIQVSEKHCGFVVNRGKGTAKDMRRLMEEVDKTVFNKFGINLEPEVRMMGEFGE